MVLHGGAEPVTLARHPRTDPERAGTIDATDVVLAMPGASSGPRGVRVLAPDDGALLRADSPARPAFACRGAVIDLLDVVTLGVPAVDLASDASGHFLLATDAAGTVRWLTLDGEDGGSTVLATGGYVAADW